MKEKNHLTATDYVAERLIMYILCNSRQHMDMERDEFKILKVEVNLIFDITIYMGEDNFF